MFCAECGTEIEEASKFCNKCGKSVLQNATLPTSTSKNNQFNSYENLTAELRAELSKFKTHTKMSCLECGYSGLMGVTGTIEPWYLSWWIWGPIGGIIGLVGGWPGVVIACILGLIIGGIQSNTQKKKAICPACKNNVISIEQI